jgi:hypothetical protein
MASRIHSSSLRMKASDADTLESLRAKLPAFWWSEVVRVRRLIEEDVEAGRFEAAYLGYAAEALVMTEDAQLAREHAPALWAASHHLTALAKAGSRQRGAKLRGAKARTPRPLASARGAARTDRTLARTQRTRSDAAHA